MRIPTHAKLQAAYRERKDRVYALLKEGVPQSEIARRVGLSRQRICQIKAKVNPAT